MGDEQPEQRDARTDEEFTEEGGDPACWLNRLCPQCDAVPDDPKDATCWRCGAELHPRD
ncbi:hypothetical protein [Streptacidiphilus fuscans]|uniref:Uncharacterized protein n=1 Tax=Streptacidiphilus fuscans TaxID=2789292 RepID=A0A931B231_9ACTN|nr:hypothetical protein [Streptacidiphilus fuscans]MBF9068833.1 hypothetical protein [Streptacidiphilus fuscans]